MSDATWIAGLMRENYEAVGFLPTQAIQDYLDRGLAVFQLDESGRRVGYLLHGPVTYGGVVTVSQHCIQTEKRLYGYGELALGVLVDRCLAAGAMGLRLRCASELPAQGFWRTHGFEEIARSQGGKRRMREIVRLGRRLYEPLFEAPQ